MLNHFRMRTIISRSKLHTVRLIKFNADLMERIVTAAMEEQEWQEAYDGTYTALVAQT
jgi:hypothetical protein